MLRRKLATAHMWTGVIIALPLVVIALSGSVLLYRDTLLVPSALSVDASRTAQNPTMDREIAHLLAEPEARELSVFYVARGNRGFHVMEWADGRRALVPLGTERLDYHLPVQLRLETALYAVHTSLLTGSGGKIVIQVLGPLAVVLLCVGLWLWWPSRRAWHARQMWPRDRKRISWLRAHMAVGAVMVAFATLQTGSGALLAHNTPIRAWLRPAWHTQADIKGDLPSFTVGDFASAIAASRAVFADGAVSQIIHDRASQGTRWTLKMRLPGEDHPNGRSTITFDVTTGKIVAARDARRGGPPAAYDDTLYPFHLGELYGPLHRLLWLLSALGLTAVIASGVTAFIFHRTRSRS